MTTDDDDVITQRRDIILSQLDGKPLDVVLKALRQTFSSSTDGVLRLAVLAARLRVLRQRIHHLRDQASVMGKEVMRGLVPHEEPAQAEGEDVNGQEPSADEEAAAQADQTNETVDQIYLRLEIIEDCILHGVKIPKGMMIEVSEHDARRLIEEGKATETDEIDPSTEQEDEAEDREPAEDGEATDDEEDDEEQDDDTNEKVVS